MRCVHMQEFQSLVRISASTLQNHLIYIDGTSDRRNDSTDPAQVNRKRALFASTHLNAIALQVFY